MSVKNFDEDELYRTWRQLVNMTSKELEEFLEVWGNVAGLSRAEASAQGIRSGRDSARAILRMKDKGRAAWTAGDWQWAKRQVAFIKRMSGARGPLLNAKGDPTRKYLSLLVWGHDPLK